MKGLTNHSRVKNILGKILDIKDEIRDKWKQADKKKLLALIFPYLLVGYLINKMAELYHYCQYGNCFQSLSLMFVHADKLFRGYLPSLAWKNMLAGIAGAMVMYFYVFQKKKDAKKFRKGEEYGSARWGNQKDIKPFMDADFKKNILLTDTERITMNGRPKKAKYARNKNILVIGGSGSGKTRFFIKPNLMQMHSSYIVTDPKGTVVLECGKLLADNGYRIKILNTINFAKSMHYNPFVYIRTEKDIMKLVNAIIANTKGEGEKSSEDFWVKAERLYYMALIGYIHYEANEDEKNFSTLLDLIDASETREDDENFKNAVDMLFDDLEKEKPEHFAVRQYKKYKLAAGAVCSK